MIERERSQRGVILVGVMWGVVLIAVIAGSFVHGTGTEVRIVINGLAAAQARALADGGVYLAIADLLESRGNRRRLWDGASRSARFETGTVTYTIQDEGGKVDLNTGVEGLFAVVFRTAGIDAREAKALEDAILDWRDADRVRRPTGAEDQDYVAAGKSVHPANGPFVTVDELRNVLGITDQTFRAVAPALTVYSGRRGVDPAVAPRAVLRALLADPEALDRFIANRRSADGGGVRTRVRDIRISRRFISSSSRSAFSIRSEARLDTGAVFIRVAVVGIDGAGEARYRIYDWRQAFSASVADGRVSTNTH